MLSALATKKKRPRKVLEIMDRMMVKWVHMHMSKHIIFYTLIVCTVYQLYLSKGAKYKLYSE